MPAAESGGIAAGGENLAPQLTLAERFAESGGDGTLGHFLARASDPAPATAPVHSYRGPNNRRRDCYSAAPPSLPLAGVSVWMERGASA